MALFKVTVKANANVNGIRLEKGMSVEVQVGYPSSQKSVVLSTKEGREKVAQAFMTKYNVDVNKAYAVNTGRMDVEKIN